MSKIQQVIEFLNEHKDLLVTELCDEFKENLLLRQRYKGFKKILFDKRLHDKMVLCLLDKIGILNAEERLWFYDEEPVKKLLDEIIGRCYE